MSVCILRETVIPDIFLQHTVRIHATIVTCSCTTDPDILIEIDGVPFDDSSGIFPESHTKVRAVAE